MQVLARGEAGFPCFLGTRLVGGSTIGKFVNGGRYMVNKVGEKIGLRDEQTLE